MENQNTILSLIVKLGKIDSAIGQVLAQKQNLDNNQKNKAQTLSIKQKDLEKVAKTLSEKKSRYEQEERAIKEERDKLVIRRKALASMNNYKVQQAAEKEIEHASKQLNVQEDSLLSSMEVLEQLEKEVSTLSQSVESLQKEYKELKASTKNTLSQLQDKLRELTGERNRIITLINPTYLSTYEKVRERNPLNPIALIKDNKSCGSCAIQIGPQLLVEVNRASSISKCPGCGRVLYLDQEE